MKIINEDTLEDLSQEEFVSIFDMCIKNLESLGPKFKINWDEVQFNGFFRGSSKFGECALGETSTAGQRKFIMLISLNKYLLKKDFKNLLINNIYHEFCHYYQNRDAIKANILVLPKSEGENFINSDASNADILYYRGLENDAGHSACWQEYVNKVNSSLNPEIPVTAFIPDDVHKYFTNKYQDEIIFEIRCKNCDLVETFIDFVPEELPNNFIEFLITLNIMSEAHQNNNFCSKCHGSLYIIIKDPRFKQFLKELTVEYAIKMLTRSNKS